MGRGVLMYNVGHKMLARLYVAMKTLRDVWDGPACILAEEPHEPVRAWAREWDIEFIPVEFSTPQGRKRTYLNACECHKFTPHDVTMWLDSDIMCLRDFTPMLDAAEQFEFCIAQFADWTSGSRRIRKRIESWRDTYPEWIDAALDLGPAINCGVFAFSKTSKLMADWHRLAMAGRDFSFIPDETCCQVILPQYRHKIMPHWFNTSCRYDKPKDEECRIVHYHGNKHCRIQDIEALKKDIAEDKKKLREETREPYRMALLEEINRNSRKVVEPFLNNSDLWLKEFEQVRGKVEKCVQHDRQLRLNLGRWDKCKNSL